MEDSSIPTATINAIIEELELMASGEVFKIDIYKVPSFKSITINSAYAKTARGPAVNCFQLGS